MVTTARDGGMETVVTFEAPDIVIYFMYVILQKEELKNNLLYKICKKEILRK